eukprot:GHVP01015789.1.p1 GENE.GHVP01015789.1~~GHVP01015789.1.p1  ORF type:complete len:148 (-),score=4.89 GHVP01015789.1:199-642(-)
MENDPFETPGDFTHLQALVDHMVKERYPSSYDLKMPNKEVLNSQPQPTVSAARNKFKRLLKRYGYACLRHGIPSIFDRQSLLDVLLDLLPPQVVNEYSHRMFVNPTVQHLLAWLNAMGGLQTPNSKPSGSQCTSCGISTRSLNGRRT